MPAVSSSVFKGKIAGVPKPVVLLVVAVAAFFLFRKLKSAGSTTSTSAGTNATPTSADNTQYPSTPSDSTGGGSGAIQAADLAELLAGLQGGSQNAATGAPSTYNYYYYNTSTPGMDQAGGGNTTSTATTGATTSTQPTTSYTPGAGNLAPGDAWAGDFTPAAAKTAAAKLLAPAPAAFGGVTGTKTLANGSTITTYASGRQVQQAPGKSAYVVKK